MMIHCSPGWHFGYCKDCGPKIYEELQSGNVYETPPCVVSHVPSVIYVVRVCHWYSIDEAEAHSSKKSRLFPSRVKLSNGDRRLLCQALEECFNLH